MYPHTAIPTDSTPRMYLDNIRSNANRGTVVRQDQETAAERDSHHVFNAELLLVQSLLQGVRVAEAWSRIDEHETPALGFQEAASEAWRS